MKTLKLTTLFVIVLISIKAQSQNKKVVLKVKSTIPGLQTVTDVDSVTNHTVSVKHLSGSGSSPTFWGYLSTVTTFAGNDIAGRVYHSTTSGATSGDQKICDITFAVPYKTAPAVIVCPANTATATAVPYVYNITTTGFSVYLKNLSVSTGYEYNYMVVQVPNYILP